jgi:hypothetical protein
MDTPANRKAMPKADCSVWPKVRSDAQQSSFWLRLKTASRAVRLFRSMEKPNRDQLERWPQQPLHGTRGDDRAPFRIGLVIFSM